MGNLPAADGTAATVQPGALTFIDRHGKNLGAITNPSFVNGPWGMAVHELGNGTAQLFVSNVLAGNIVRFDIAYDATGEIVSVSHTVTIASGYSHRTDPAALVLGPSGLAYDAVHDILYVASSTDNAVYRTSMRGAWRCHGSAWQRHSDLSGLRSFAWTTQPRAGADRPPSGRQ